MVQRSCQPVEVGSLSHDLQGFIHPTLLFGISSINSSNTAIAMIMMVIIKK